MAEDSSGIQYSDAPPTVTGNTSDKDPSGRSNTVGGGDDSDQSSRRSGSTAEGKSKDGSDDEQGGAGGGNDGGKGGAAGKQAGDERSGAGGDVKPLDASAASSDDGSSPLVPILIALAVLAAISFGVLAMRKKRRDTDPGAPASTEAG
ncbi:MAG TPA: hypothetical protein VHF50_00530 [Solirubrobacterales bacterium]|nr:hypothetical protein [Solirubrobacterales bacterium]